MDKFIVEGGRALEGEIAVSGSKNAVLPILAAGLLTEGEVIVERAPELLDVRTMLALLAALGAETERMPDGSVPSFEPPQPPAVRADWDLVRKMRGSVCVLGPLLGAPRPRRGQPAGRLRVRRASDRCPPEGLRGARRHRFESSTAT